MSLEFYLLVQNDLLSTTFHVLHQSDFANGLVFCALFALKVCGIFHSVYFSFVYIIRGFLKYTNWEILQLIAEPRNFAFRGLRLLPVCYKL